MRENQGGLGSGAGRGGDQGPPRVGVDGHWKVSPVSLRRPEVAGRRREEGGESGAGEGGGAGEEEVGGGVAAGGGGLLESGGGRAGGGGVEEEEVGGLDVGEEEVEALDRVGGGGSVERRGTQVLRGVADRSGQALGRVVVAFVAFDEEGQEVRDEGGVMVLSGKVEGSVAVRVGGKGAVADFGRRRIREGSASHSSINVINSRSQQIIIVPRCLLLKPDRLVGHRARGAERSGGEQGEGELHELARTGGGVGGGGGHGWEEGGKKGRRRKVCSSAAARSEC